MPECFGQPFPLPVSSPREMSVQGTRTQPPKENCVICWVFDFQPQCRSQERQAGSGWLRVFSLSSAQIRVLESHSLVGQKATLSREIGEKDKSAASFFAQRLGLSPSLHGWVIALGAGSLLKGKRGCWPGASEWGQGSPTTTQQIVKMGGLTP